MTQDVRTEFRRHLASLGYELDAPPKVIDEKLRALMGEDRYRQMKAAADRPSTANKQEESYKHYRSLAEANLFRSFDGTAVVDANTELYQHAAAEFRPGTRVLELGCWTGGLASFIAERHPACQVVGVDGEQPVVDAANAHYGLPNLRFFRWNYFRSGMPQDMEPADVLLCAMGVVHHLPRNDSLYDPLDVRRSGEYRAQNEHAAGYFGLWRMAAKEGAQFFAVLRVQLFARFLAWLDAAAEVGWMPELQRTWAVPMRGDKSEYVLPGFVFRAVARPPFPREALARRLPQDLLMDHWAWFDSHRAAPRRAYLEGGAALSAYRGLIEKRVLGRWQGRLANVLTRDEVGTCGASAYVFRHDAGGAFKFLPVSAPVAQQLSATLATNRPVSIFNEPQQPKVPTNPFFQGKSPFAG